MIRAARPQVPRTAAGFKVRDAHFVASYGRVVLVYDPAPN